MPIQGPSFFASDLRDAELLNVRDFGAVGDGSTDDGAAINRAITMASGRGGVVWIPGGTFNTSQTIDIPDGVSILGVGSKKSILHYTGSGVAVEATLEGSFTGDQSIEGISVTGVAASDVGIRVGDCWGFALRDVSIRDFTTGIGLQLYNDSHWTEGTNAGNVGVQNCATGIAFTRSATSSYDSFGYTRFLGVSVNVPDGGVGVVLGDDSLLSGTHYIYDSTLIMNFWLGDGANAVEFTANSAGTGNMVHFTGERESGATGTRSFAAQAPSYFRCSGVVNIEADTTTFPSDFNLYLTLGPFIGGPRVELGSGDPEGDLDGVVGSLFLRSDGGAGTTLYVKESGTGNTGWVAK